MWTILSAPRYFSDKLLHTFTFFALSYLFAFFTFSHVPCITLLADFLCEQSLNPPLDNSETNCYSIASAETWKELETFERHKFAFTTREKFTDRGNSAQLKSSSTFKFWRKTYEWVAQLGCTYRYSKKAHYRKSSWKKKRKKSLQMLVCVRTCKTKMVKCEFFLSFFFLPKNRPFFVTYVIKKENSVSFTWTYVRVRVKLTLVCFFLFFF